VREKHALLSSLFVEPDLAVHKQKTLEVIHNTSVTQVLISGLTSAFVEA
jgi:hypothetical protein